MYIYFLAASGYRPHNSGGGSIQDADRPRQQRSHYHMARQAHAGARQASASSACLHKEITIQVRIVIIIIIFSPYLPTAGHKPTPHFAILGPVPVASKS